MKYILKIKNPETQNIISEKEYMSIRQIAIDIGATYCSCHKNAMYDLQKKKPGKKFSQQLFDKKYSIMCVDE
jgi:hypothetical protein